MPVPASSTSTDPNASIVRAAVGGDTTGLPGGLATVYYNATTGELPYSSTTAVTERSVCTIPAFLAALRFLCESLAGFPKHVVRAPTPLALTREHGSALNFLLNEEANDLQTANQFWEVLFHHAIVHGNGYGIIERDAGGNPVAMYSYPPDRIFPFRSSGEQLYGVQLPAPDGGPSGEMKLAPASQVLHLPGFGFDGMRGYPVVRLMAQSLRVGKAAEAFGASFFENGGNVGLALETDAALTPEQIADLTNQIRTNHAGLTNAHKAMILQNGLKAKNMTGGNDSAQYLETRQFSVLDVCRALRVEPTIVFDYNRATWNNVQAQNTSTVQNSLMPWINRIEPEINRKLISRADRAAGLRVKFDIETLTRGDITQQIDNAYRRISAGITNVNEERARMGMPGIGPTGDVYRTPVKLEVATPTGDSPTGPAPATTPH